MNIAIKRLSNGDIGDFAELINVFADVFERENFTKPNVTYLETVLANRNFLTLVAKTDTRVLGGLTAYILHQYYSEKRLVYIYDLAVLKQFQRQGIGKALIHHLINYCKENGFQEVFVQADKVDGYALEFYRSTNATNESDVVHFSYWLDEFINS